MHIHFHSDHNIERDHPHDRPFSRVTRDLDAVLDWLTGPGMTDQQRAGRSRAEALNERYCQ
ncbi:MAG: hypothetical protein OXE17_00685 [Chloroflexi bacterium]|nr:hypothetical protein [Chloroflexota bacterium]